MLIRRFTRFKGEKNSSCVVKSFATKKTITKNKNPSIDYILQPSHKLNIVRANKWAVQQIIPKMQEVNHPNVRKDFQEMVKNINDQHDLRFNDLDLLQACFIHYRALNEDIMQQLSPSDEKLQRITGIGATGSLEFVGDAILNFLTKIYSFNEDVVFSPKDLTRLSQPLASNAVLADVFSNHIMSNYFPVEKYLVLNQTQDVCVQQSKLAADHMESIFGAKYIDSGLMETSLLFKRLLPYFIKSSSKTGASKNPVGSASELFSKLSFIDTHPDLDNDFLLKFVQVSRCIKGKQDFEGYILEDFDTKQFEDNKYIYDLPNINEIRQLHSEGFVKSNFSEFVKKNRGKQSIIVGIVCDAGRKEGRSECSGSFTLTHSSAKPILVVGYGKANNKKMAKYLCGKNILYNFDSSKKELLRMLLKTTR